MKEWKLIGILVLQLFVAIGSSIGVLLLIKKVYVETDFDYGFFAIIHFVLGVLFLFLEVLYWPLFMIVALSWWGVFKTTKKYLNSNGSIQIVFIIKIRTDSLPKE